MKRSKIVLIWMLLLSLFFNLVLFVELQKSMQRENDAINDHRETIKKQSQYLDRLSDSLKGK